MLFSGHQPSLCCDWPCFLTILLPGGWPYCLYLFLLPGGWLPCFLDYLAARRLATLSYSLLLRGGCMHCPTLSCCLEAGCHVFWIVLLRGGCMHCPTRSCCLEAAYIVRSAVFYLEAAVFNLHVLLQDIPFLCSMFRCEARPVECCIRKSALTNCFLDR